MGYIIGNVLKHKEISNKQKLLEFPFSSFRKFVKDNGLEFNRLLISSTIVIDFKESKGLVGLEKAKLPDFLQPKDTFPSV